MSPGGTDTFCGVSDKRNHSGPPSTGLLVRGGGRGLPASCFLEVPHSSGAGDPGEEGRRGCVHPGLSPVLV